jgi:signal transduction histidine kinase
MHMGKSTRSFRASAITDTALRRLRSTPSYFFLFWRWSMWLYALTVIIFFRHDPPFYEEGKLQISYNQVAFLLLSITFLQTLVITLYAPVFQVLLSRLLSRVQPSQKSISARERKRRRREMAASDEDIQVLPPLGTNRDGRWNIAIYGLDVIICGLIVYYSGPFTHPPFGVGSPFYRYGMSTAIAAALVYRYRGGLAAALGFDLFIVLGMVHMAPGASIDYTPNVIDIAGSLIDAPVAAILTAYLMTLLGRYAESKKREQEQGRHLRTLIRLPENLMKGTNNQQELLQRSAVQLRGGNNFDRLVIALITRRSDSDSDSGEESEHEGQDTHPEIQVCVEAITKFPVELSANKPEELISQVVQTGQEIMSFEPIKGDDNIGYGIARLYIRVPKDGQTQIVIGAESKRTTPFKMQEQLLRSAGSYLLIALNNLRLTEEASKLAAAAERGRIAREIHDGIAQLTYMLSLQAETCKAQAQRIAEASEEDTELLSPLVLRLDKLVTISKQALWETRNYMFSLKPLMSGRMTLTQMISNQLREFEAISDLPTSLRIDGEEEIFNGDQRRARRHAQIGTALFRIVQEALTNTYKHAGATRIEVLLKFEPASISVEVHDDGQGLPVNSYSYDLADDGVRERVYSGHGMGGMRERARELGGIFEASSRDTGGASVRACIPL